MYSWRHRMLRIRNNYGSIAVVLLLLAPGARLDADNRVSAHLVSAAPVAKQTSLKLSSDCCETAAPAPAPAPCKTYKPCVTYRGCWDCCGPKVSQTLKVKDP